MNINNNIRSITSFIIMNINNNTRVITTLRVIDTFINIKY